MFIGLDMIPPVEGSAVGLSGYSGASDTEAAVIAHVAAVSGHTGEVPQRHSAARRYGLGDRGLGNRHTVHRGER